MTDRPEPDTGEDSHRPRESALGIDQGSRVAFFLLFVPQMIVWSILITLEEMARGDHATTRSLAIAIAQGVSPLVIVNIATTVILIQGVRLMIISQEYLRNRFVKPVIAAHEAKGRAEGEAIGKAEGELTRHMKWDSWNRRRMEAEAQGIPFNEPPPSSPNEND